MNAKIANIIARFPLEKFFEVGFKIRVRYIEVEYEAAINHILSERHKNYDWLIQAY